MNSCISVKNSAALPVSVDADDCILAADIPPKKQSICKPLTIGSVRITVYSISGKLLFDIWVSIAPSLRYILEIFDTECIFKQAPSP